MTDPSQARVGTPIIARRDCWFIGQLHGRDMGARVSCALTSESASCQRTDFNARNVRSFTATVVCSRRSYKQRWKLERNITTISDQTHTRQRLQCHWGQNNFAPELSRAIRYDAYTG